MFGHLAEALADVILVTEVTKHKALMTFFRGVVERYFPSVVNPEASGRDFAPGPSSVTPLGSPRQGGGPVSQSHSTMTPPPSLTDPLRDEGVETQEALLRRTVLAADEANAACKLNQLADCVWAAEAAAGRAAVPQAAAP